VRISGGGFSLSAVTYFKRPTQGGLSLPPFRAADFHPKKCGDRNEVSQLLGPPGASLILIPPMRDDIGKLEKCIHLCPLAEPLGASEFVCVFVWLSGIAAVGSPSLLRVSLSLSLLV